MDYITSSYTKTSKNSFETIKKFLNYYDNPQDKLKIIHVAGTNGKGSTCILLNNILVASGYKVGLFTSPHIKTPNERIKINNLPISENDLELEVDKIKKISEIVFGNTTESLSFFELFTVMAFNYFYIQKVDFVILETGIGGKNDCTNIINDPILSIITSISLDHTNILGNTLTDIAKQKAGIIKKNSKLVLYTQTEEDFKIFLETAKLQNAEIYYLDDEFLLDITYMDLNKTIFNIQHKYFSYTNIKTKLLGKYQVYNIATALLALYALKDFIKTNNNIILASIQNTLWAGRMEKVYYKERLFLLEGAHNEDAMKSLKDSLDIYCKNMNLVIIIGVLNDKDYKSMFSIINNIKANIILTKPNNYRAVNPNDLESYFDNNVIIIEDYKKAIEKAIQISNNNTIICITGSLYLVGDCHTFLTEV